MSSQAVEKAQKFIPVEYHLPQRALLSYEINFPVGGDGQPLRNMDCYKDGTLLVELANGFWGRENGNYTFPALRKSIHESRGYGEWTDDYINFDAQVPAGVVVPAGYKRVVCIQMADKIVERKGKYHAEGGIVVPVELPPTGWQVPDSEGRMFHSVTGSPLATVKDQEAAERMLTEAGYAENDVSYFYRREEGLATVLRDHLLSDGGPFCVDTSYEPGDRDTYVGVRSCSRSSLCEAKTTPEKSLLVSHLSNTKDY